VNVAVSEPAAMLTFVGAVNVALLIERLTVAALVDVVLSATVQVVFCPLLKLPEAQFKLDNCALGVTLRLKVVEIPFAAAVSVDV
jgi:hypothetical protein